FTRDDGAIREVPYPDARTAWEGNPDDLMQGAAGAKHQGISGPQDRDGRSSHGSSDMQRPAVVGDEKPAPPEKCARGSQRQGTSGGPRRNRHPGHDRLSQSRVGRATDDDDWSPPGSSQRITDGRETLDPPPAGN